MPKYLPLGTAVMAESVFEREIGGHCNSHSTSKTWKAKKAGMAGIIVGVRTLSSGASVYYSDEGYNWKPDEYHRAYLVAVDLFKKPVLAPIDGVRVTEHTPPEGGTA